MTNVEVDTGNDRTQVRSVWMVTREYDKLAGAGGVKDVCRQLAETLAASGGCQVRAVLPRYGFMDPAALGFTLAPVGGRSGRIGGRRYEHTFDVDMHYTGEERRETVAVWQADIEGVRIFLVEADRYATKRAVYTYTEEDEQEVAWQRKGGGHYDYFAMNILLQKAALDLMILLGEQADVIHCHDGHAATLPAIMREGSGYRHYFRRSGALVTIHNAGLGYHQEVADLAFARAVTGLPARVIMRGRLNECFDPFVAAADYAILNTVSEQYGWELQQTAEDSRTGWLGHTLLERGVPLAGVTNGIDPAAFDTTAPAALGLAAAYDVGRGNFAGKEMCKRSLLAAIAANGPWGQVRQYGTLDADPERPLGTFIGRLTSQKGVDILIQALRELLPHAPSLQFVFLGSGSFEFEEELQQLTASDFGRERICFLKGYDATLANKVYASGDFFLIPSRYEPCGLTDYIAQLFGNLPIVHRVGGLVKVIDGETGFSYGENTPAKLAEVMAGALQLYRHHPHLLRTMRMAAVERIQRLHTWGKVMESYLDLYRRAMVMAGET
jgi:starch synthase